MSLSDILKLIQLINQLIPTIISVIKSIDEQFPKATGPAKLEVALSMLGGSEVPASVLTPIINSVVAANKTLKP